MLDSSGEGRAVFAKENTAKATGVAEDEVIFYMQPHSHEPTSPASQEPEESHWEENVLILPASFQLLRFGRWLDPRSAENNPVRMQVIAEEAAKAVPDLPEEVKDVLNWTLMYADEDKGTFV